MKNEELLRMCALSRLSLTDGETEEFRESLKSLIRTADSLSDAPEYAGDGKIGKFIFRPDSPESSDSEELTPDGGYFTVKRVVL